MLLEEKQPIIQINRLVFNTLGSVSLQHIVWLRSWIIFHTFYFDYYSHTLHSHGTGSLSFVVFSSLGFIQDLLHSTAHHTRLDIKTSWFFGLLSAFYMLFLCEFHFSSPDYRIMTLFTFSFLFSSFDNVFVSFTIRIPNIRPMHVQNVRNNKLSFLFVLSCFSGVLQSSNVWHKQTDLC